MNSLSQNHQLRKYYLEKDEVPTQSIIKETMKPPLANICFKSLSPKAKVFAGLEPPLKGGGDIWYNPPRDLLQGRSVFKPLKKQYMKKWNCYGLDEIGMQLIEVYRSNMKSEKERIIDEFNANMKDVLTSNIHQCWVESSKSATAANTKYISNAFDEFCRVYKTSIEHLQRVLLDAAVKRIKTLRIEICKMKQQHFEQLLKRQAAALNKSCEIKLNKEKEKYKNIYLEEMEKYQNRLAAELHDINVEKHVAIEKSRKYLESQKLACQIYVALKEKEECATEIELAKHDNSKEMSNLSKSLAYTEFRIHYADNKQREQQKLNEAWIQKMCRVVKELQSLVVYCLKTAPEQAEFFINMEKLILLQFNEALKNPNVGSIIMKDVDLDEKIVAKEKPFYLICDRRNAEVDTDLCPKHVTSSTSQMPAVVVNKRCLYAACDNFKQFGDKLEHYLQNECSEDTVDEHDYSRNLQVQYSSSEQLRELKLQSSLMQILQQEIGNITNVPIECPVCKIPHCFCCDRSHSANSAQSLTATVECTEQPTSSKLAARYKDMSKETKVKCEREPKVESYLRYVLPNKCDCSKLAKKHLAANMPAYMINTSAYESPELLNYEMCTVREIKSLVNKALNKNKNMTEPLPQKVKIKTNEMATQTVDLKFDHLCACFSDETMKCVGSFSQDSKEKISVDRFQVVGGTTCPSFLTKDCNTFATERMHSLLKLFEQYPSHKKIFTNSLLDI